MEDVLADTSQPGISERELFPEGLISQAHLQYPAAFVITHVFSLYTWVYSRGKVGWVWGWRFQSLKMCQMGGVVKNWECGWPDLRVEAYGTKHSAKKRFFFFWLLCICMHTQTTLQKSYCLRK